VIAVTVGDEKFAKEFGTLLGQMKRPRALLVNVGQEARNQLKAHFRFKDQNEPNRLGGKRTHYWIGVADSVQNPMLEAADTQVRISITEPTIGQKVFGGRIVPKNVDNLTVPQTAEAYGRTASTFEAETGLKLFLLTNKTGSSGGGGGNRGFAALAAKFASGAVVVEFILRRWVDQQKDPTALPDMREGSPFIKALLGRGQAVVQRQIKDAGPNNQGGIEN
jgi:hypothetical protein